MPIFGCIECQPSLIQLKLFGGRVDETHCQIIYFKHIYRNVQSRSVYTVVLDTHLFDASVGENGSKAQKYSPTAFSLSALTGKGSVNF